MKRISILIATLLVLTSCSPAQEPTQETLAEGETRIFVDSLGREVEIPLEITAIAPSGPLAQLVLYTAVPDLLAGIAYDFSAESLPYIDEKYTSLPKFGQFYGKNASMNIEEIIAHAPDVIIDIGETKEGMGEELDLLQEQVNIPVLFIECTLENVESAYLMLADLTGETERCNALASDAGSIVSNAALISAKLTEDEIVDVYIAMGDAGLHTNAKDSFHGEALNRAGVNNVVHIEASSQGGGTEVSFEQIIQWNPEIILANTQTLYDMITTDAMWGTLDAVKNGKVYSMPTIPYGFLQGASVNCLIGIEWVGSLAYPEHYTDLDEKVRKFYESFYNITLKDDELKTILNQK